MKKIILFLLLCLPLEGAEVKKWIVTAYCSCEKCCSPKYADGITASGRKVKYGMVACNWLPFGTKLLIEGYGIFTVEDRGSRKHFGTRKEKRKRIDLYLPSHREALKFGRKKLYVIILGK